MSGYQAGSCGLVLLFPGNLARLLCYKPGTEGGG